jgi:hypothetical protein
LQLPPCRWEGIKKAVNKKAQSYQKGPVIL